MRKYFFFSFGIHALGLLVFSLMLCPWAERACPVAKLATVDVEVLQISKSAGAQARNDQRTKKSPSRTRAAASQESERVHVSGVAKPGNVLEDVVRISKEELVTSLQSVEGMEGSSITIEQYMHWTVRNNKPPIYPRLAQLRGEEGRAMIEVAVSGRDGRLESAAIVQSSGSELLDSISLDAVREWRFSRFQAAQESVRFRIPFRFALK